MSRPTDDRGRASVTTIKAIEASKQKSKSFHASVAGSSQELDQDTIPAGQVWRILRVVGSADFTGDTFAAVVWDVGGANTVLFLTYGSLAVDVGIALTGDGSKKLGLLLKNTGSNTRDLWLAIEAERIE
jgi:hypothetical protein